ncbi:unnamed protein product [Linum trigynum]|uniref:Uncharacterized protein n=1 Tax=Linum trigynum TaxID=586398 RepID=A0AAV2CHD1_9ROSI
MCKNANLRGGLWLWDLQLHNQAHLLKWQWRFATERQRSWRELIALKFPNQNLEWCDGEIGERMGCSPWMQLIKLKNTFWNSTQVEHGNCLWTSFWHNIWIKGKHLADQFPRVVAGAESPSARVADYLQNDGEALYMVGNSLKVSSSG